MKSNYINHLRCYGKNLYSSFRRKPLKTKMLYLGIPLFLLLSFGGIEKYQNSVKKKNYETFYSGLMDWCKVPSMNRKFYEIDLNIGGRIVPGRISSYFNPKEKRWTTSYSCPHRIVILDENTTLTKYKIFGFEVGIQKNGKWKCLGSAIDENEDNDISKKEFRSEVPMKKLLKRSRFEMKDEGTFRSDEPQQRLDTVNI